MARRWTHSCNLADLSLVIPQRPQDVTFLQSSDFALLKTHDATTWRKQKHPSVMQFVSLKTFREVNFFTIIPSVSLSLHDSDIDCAYFPFLRFCRTVFPGHLPTSDQLTSTSSTSLMDMLSSNFGSLVIQNLFYAVQ